MPVPVELLRFFDRAAPSPSPAQPPGCRHAGHQRLAAARAATPALPLPASAALTAPLNAAPETPAAV
jgi:hypothetical protein